MGIMDFRKTPDAGLPTRLSDASLNATYVPKWKPNTAYLAGDAVLNPSGDTVTAIANFTSGASFNAANWNYSPTYASKADAAGEAALYPLRRLANKVAALNAGVARVGWLTTFDSYAQKIFLQVFPLLQTLFGGLAGTFFAGSAAGITTNATTGTVADNVADFANWPSGLTSTFSAGSTRTYGVSGSSFTCDTIKVYWINAGGGFKIQVDGVDNTTPTVTSDNSLGVATITVSRAAHTVTLVQTSGSPVVVGIGLVDSTVSGIVPINVAQGGIALNKPSTQAWTNFQTFLADVQPDVMTFEAKENVVYGDDSTTYAAALVKLFTRTAAGAPNMDVVGIGSPPVSVGDADQVGQNAVLKSACATAGYTYYDTYALFGSYANLSAVGWQGDGVHVDVKADQYRGMLMLRDLGILNLFGREALQRLVVPSVTYQRTSDTKPIGKTVATQFDLQVWASRYFQIYDLTGATERWRMSGTNDISDFVPNKIRVGTTGGPGLVANSNTELQIMRGDSTANPADLSVRSLASAVTTLNAQSGAVTLDLSTGSVFVVNLTGNVTSLAFSNAGRSGQDIEVHFVQDATGSRTLAGVNASIHLAGNALTLTTTGGKRDILRFRQISSSYSETARSMNV